MSCRVTPRGWRCNSTDSGNLSWEAVRVMCCCLGVSHCTSNQWLDSVPNSTVDPRGWKSRRERGCTRPSPHNYCGHRASKAVECQKCLPGPQLSGYLLEFRAHRYREGKAGGQQRVWSELRATWPVHSRAQLTAVWRGRRGSELSIQERLCS